MPESSPWSTVGIPSTATSTGTAQGALRGGTRGARLVAGTWWHLKVIGKGKERETWPLPWLPPSILQHRLRAVIPVLHRRAGLWQGRKGWMAPGCAVWFWGELRLLLSKEQ